jgi:hypothetical protein
LDNVQLVEFSNDEVRQMGDLCTRLDIRTAALNAEYLARGLGDIITAGGAGNLIVDGSATDGRTPCTGNDLLNMVTLVQALQTFFAVAGRRDVIAKWNVNGHRG